MVIYVGDSGDVIKRIRTNHCSGNVEASALRKHIAKAKGFKIQSFKRASGSTRIRIDSPEPRNAENDVSSYIHSGSWKIVLCDSYKEAHDFQWFTVERLKPLLNVNIKPWNNNNLERYKYLFTQIENSTAFKYEQLKGATSGSGVYVLYHQMSP